MPSRHGHNWLMRISAKADYAVRAALDLTENYGSELRSAESIAADKQIPASFLEGILTSLRKAGVVESKRGAGGGYRLAAHPSKTSIGDIIRAVDGPLVFVRDTRPSDLPEADGSPTLAKLWVALRASVRSVLDSTSLEQLATDSLPDHVKLLLTRPDSWSNAPAGEQES